MRFYGNIEEANKEAQQRAAAYRTATNLIPTITKVVKDFDGKVYNCRLEKALKEATNNEVFCSKNDYCLEIYTYQRQGYSRRINLAYIKAEDLKDGKRIPAAKIIESFQSHRETLLKNAFEIESDMENMQYVKAYIKETIEKLEKYCRSFNTDLRDIYGLPYCVRVD
jgi:hypothetical protein